MNKRFEIVPAFFWIGFGIFFVIFSYKLELGNFGNPGPGLIPFLLGIILVLLVIFIIIKSFKKEVKNNNKNIEAEVYLEKVKIKKVGIIFVLLFVYAILLEKLGYLSTTLLFLTFLFRIVTLLKWKFCLATALLIVSVTYIFFTLLGVRFPRGVFWIF